MNGRSLGAYFPTHFIFDFISQNPLLIVAEQKLEARTFCAQNCTLEWSIPRKSLL
jgi:hypothetical protein